MTPCASLRQASPWLATVLLLCLAVRAHAEEILIGQTAALTGPTQALGIGMRTGIECAFQEINAADTLGGRTLRLISRDDGYEPPRAAANARALLAQDKVFLLAGCVGTPTAVEIMPITNAAGVHFFGAFTGAGSLRTDTTPLVINLRASYGQEIERLVTLLVDGRGLRKIACFHQDDAYGQAGLKALNVALQKRRLAPVALGVYPRNTTEVAAALQAIVPAAPEAIVMVGTYGACASFIKEARAMGLTDAIYCNISFVGTRALVAALGTETDGVIISQVVPHPVGSTAPIVEAYRQSLARYAPDAEPDWISLEGYLVGHTLAALIQRAGPELTQASFAAALKDPAPIDLRGLSVVYGPGRNQGFDQVYLTRIRNGKIVSIE
jgi:ABC-type branched-subunit amino acid transport system substrate-binding protein